LLSKFIISLAFIALLVMPREAGARQQSNANSNATGKRTHTAKTAPKLQPNPIFDEILSDLKRKTRVPLRLPAYWPFSERTPDDQLKKDQGEENLYATIVDVSDRHYAIRWPSAEIVRENTFAATVVSLAAMYFMMTIRSARR